MSEECVYMYVRVHVLEYKGGSAEKLVNTLALIRVWYRKTELVSVKAARGTLSH